MKHESDELLDFPLLLDEEIKSWRRDIEALQRGEKTNRGPDFWNRVTVEMQRRQVNFQIRAAESQRRAAWWLVVATICLIGASIASVVIQAPLGRIFGHGWKL